jgi:integrase/recombinase XerD
VHLNRIDRNAHHHGSSSVLTDNEIRRVFRIIETTRHAERDRLAFVLSVYAGLRVGEIAALTIGDVSTQDGQARREIKLGAHQTKGSKGRTVVLSNRVRSEIDAHLRNRANHHHHATLIASQQNGHCDVSEDQAQRLWRLARRKGA